MCKIDVQVVLNQAQLPSLEPAYLVISPGPRSPSESGNSKRLIQHFHGRIPILGVCLGHQCIGELFGSRVIHAHKPIHGKTSEIIHDGRGVFKNMKQKFHAARYHSLVIEKENLPDCLEVSAITAEGEIMGVHHKVYPTIGVQFHPESIATEDGLKIIQNFLTIGENYAKTNIHLSRTSRFSLPASRTNALHHQA